MRRLLFRRPANMGEQQQQQQQDDTYNNNNHTTDDSSSILRLVQTNNIPVPQSYDLEKTGEWTGTSDADDDDENAVLLRCASHFTSINNNYGTTTTTPPKEDAAVRAPAARRQWQKLASSIDDMLVLEDTTSSSSPPEKQKQREAQLLSDFRQGMDFTLGQCLVAVAIYLVVAVAAFSFLLDHFTVIDACYFAVVTFTTVGYVDQVDWRRRPLGIPRCSHTFVYSIVCLC